MVKILSWQKLLTLTGCDFIQSLKTQENKLNADRFLHIPHVHIYTWYPTMKWWNRSYETKKKQKKQVNNKQLVLRK